RRSREAKPRAFRSPFSSNAGFNFKTLPAVLATRTISLSKFTSGTFSATFHALTSFAKSLALVMTPFSGISLASLSSSTEPIQVLVGLIGVGSAAATPATRNITAARESHLRDNIVGLLERRRNSQRKKPNKVLCCIPRRRPVAASAAYLATRPTGR